MSARYCSTVAQSIRARYPGIRTCCHSQYLLQSHHTSSSIGQKTWFKDFQTIPIEAPHTLHRSPTLRYLKETKGKQSPYNRITHHNFSKLFRPQLHHTTSSPPPIKTQTHSKWASLTTSPNPTPLCPRPALPSTTAVAAQATRHASTLAPSHPVLPPQVPPRASRSPHHLPMPSSPAAVAAPVTCTARRNAPCSRSTRSSHSRSA